MSIGGIDGAIIAGNPAEPGVERLYEFWDGITARPVVPFTGDGDFARTATSA